MAWFDSLKTGASKAWGSGGWKSAFASKDAWLRRGATGAIGGFAAGAGINAATSLVGGTIGTGDGMSFGNIMRSGMKGAAIGGGISMGLFRGGQPGAAAARLGAGISAISPGLGNRLASRAGRMSGSGWSDLSGSMQSMAAGASTGFKNRITDAWNLVSSGALQSGQFGALASLGGMGLLAANSSALTSRVPSNYGYR